MKVQRIASFEQRMQRYRNDLRYHLLFETPLLLLACVGASMGMLYIVSLSQPPATNVFGDWRVMGLVSGLGLAFWPIQIMWPEKPKASDVEQDRALRRAFGMDDAVDDSGPSNESGGSSST